MISSVSSTARRYPNKKQDLAFVHFNITAGLNHCVLLKGTFLIAFMKIWLLFSTGTRNNSSCISRLNTRTRKGYVAMTVSLSSSANKRVQTKNDVVIWDRIVRRKEDAFVKFAGKNKYMFRDISSSFKYVAGPSLISRKRCSLLCSLEMYPLRITPWSTTSCPMSAS